MWGEMMAQEKDMIRTKNKCVWCEGHLVISTKGDYSYCENTACPRYGLLTAVFYKPK